MIDAYMGLLRERARMPSADDIAGRAGCSTRLVFAHFGDILGLGLAAADQAFEHARVAGVARNVDADRATRIATHVEIRALICETWLPLWRTAATVQGKSSRLRSRLAMAHDIVFKRLELMYAPELGVLSELERRRLLIALEAIIDFQSWGRMREDEGLSIEQARMVWIQVIDRMLPPTPSA